MASRKRLREQGKDDDWRERKSRRELKLEQQLEEREKALEEREKALEKERKERKEREKALEKERKERKEREKELEKERKEREKERKEREKERKENEKQIQELRKQVAEKKIGDCAISGLYWMRCEFDELTRNFSDWTPEATFVAACTSPSNQSTPPPKVREYL